MDLASHQTLSGVVELDRLSMEKMLRDAEKVVIVEFYTTGCPICQQLAPMYEQLSREMDNAVFARIDAEANIDIALQYGVLATPTFKFFCGSRFLGEIVGDTNATIMRNTVRDLIRHKSCPSGSRNVSYEMDGYG